MVHVGGSCWWFIQTFCSDDEEAIILRGAESSTHTVFRSGLVVEVGIGTTKAEGDAAKVVVVEVAGFTADFVDALASADGVAVAGRAALCSGRARWDVFVVEFGIRASVTGRDTKVEFVAVDITGLTGHGVHTIGSTDAVAVASRSTLCSSCAWWDVFVVELRMWAPIFGGPACASAVVGITSRTRWWADTFAVGDLPSEARRNTNGFGDTTC